MHNNHECNGIMAASKHYAAHVRGQESSDERKGNGMRRLLLTGLLAGINLFSLAQSHKLTPSYDFSLPREEKIRLAKSAAPPEISDKATVYVLERSGYVKVHDGTNGFSCFVDRQTPLDMLPTCFDAEGSSTTLLPRLYAEAQRAKGESEDQITAEIAQGYLKGKFRAPSKPGVVYMLSESNYLLDSDDTNPKLHMIHMPPHLMFYAPYATAKDIGTPPSARNLPRLIRGGQPDAYMIVFTPREPSTLETKE
jgi:hypothetical protein